MYGGICMFSTSWHGCQVVSPKVCKMMEFRMNPGIPCSMAISSCWAHANGTVWEQIQWSWMHSSLCPDYFKYLVLLIEPSYAVSTCTSDHQKLKKKCGSVICTYHGMETSAEVMSCNKNMVTSFASVPVGHGRGNQRYCWMNSPGCMANRWEPSLGTKFTRHIHREEEEVSFIWIQSSKGAAQ